MLTIKIVIGYLFIRYLDFEKFELHGPTIKINHALFARLLVIFSGTKVLGSNPAS